MLSLILHIGHIAVAIAFSAWNKIDASVRVKFH